MSTQEEICKKHGSAYIVANDNDTLLVAKKSLGQKPTYGIRHKITDGFSGWKIWAGSIEKGTVFTEIKVKEIESVFPVVEPYLGLSPGHSFEKSKSNVVIKYSKSTKLK